MLDIFHMFSTFIYLKDARLFQGDIWKERAW